VHTAAPFTAAAREAFPGLLPWQAPSAMSTARANFTATLLPSGKVLVTGGQCLDSGTFQTVVLSSAELSGSKRTPACSGPDRG
jgi:hypothetical protein